jgi:MFS transporter, CP family, cyanate transporter
MWIAGIDLRLTLLAVPPVIPLIHRDLHLNEKAIALLSGVPVLLLGLAAIPGSLLIARIGARRAAAVGLALIAIASAWRGLGPSEAMLFAMTFAMGTGIAITQPAMPTIVGEWFPRAIPLATAVYANGILIGEALSASLTIPLVLPLVGGSWAASFVVWSIPVAATAIVMWFAAPRDRAATSAPSRRWWPDWRDRTTWQLGLLQGGGSLTYFAANAFIPDYLHATGHAELVAPALATLNIAQLPASFVLLFFARTLIGRRLPIVAVGALAVLALLLLLSPLPAAIVAGAAIAGFVGAFIIVLSLALPPLLVPHGDVHRLSAAMFTIGYTSAFLIPIAGGAIWDATRIPATAFISLALGAAMILAASTTLKLRDKLANAAASAVTLAASSE